MTCKVSQLRSGRAVRASNCVSPTPDLTLSRLLSWVNKISAFTQIRVSESVCLD